MLMVHLFSRYILNLVLDVCKTTFEPFVNAKAMLFALQPVNVVISVSNAELIKRQEGYG